jgi:hypothetical protein
LELLQHQCLHFLGVLTQALAMDLLLLDCADSAAAAAALPSL